MRKVTKIRALTEKYFLPSWKSGKINLRKAEKDRYRRCTGLSLVVFEDRSMYEKSSARYMRQKKRKEGGYAC